MLPNVGLDELDTFVTSLAGEVILVHPSNITFSNVEPYTFELVDFLVGVVENNPLFHVIDTLNVSLNDT